MQLLNCSPSNIRVTIKRCDVYVGLQSRLDGYETPTVITTRSVKTCNNNLIRKKKINPYRIGTAIQPSFSEAEGTKIPEGQQVNYFQSSVQKINLFYFRKTLEICGLTKF